jgi:hypothetical protein
MNGLEAVPAVEQYKAQLASVPCAAGDEAHERRRQRGLAQQVKLLHDGRAAEAERYRRVQRHVGDHVLVHEARPAHGLRYCDDELHG